MNISPNFSPSIQLMKPYFLLSSFFYVVSMVWLYFINPFALTSDFTIVGWVHLYMVGFVMMAIISAMAQLGPVIAETKHYAVWSLKFIWIFLAVGIVGLVIGFYKVPMALLIGGGTLFVGILLYVLEFMVTIQSLKRKKIIIHTMKMSNLFLLFGLISGLVMASFFNGYVLINLPNILQAHLFGLIVGVVILLIMGLSNVLIPMFGSTKYPKDKQFILSFIPLNIAVVIMLLYPAFPTKITQEVAYGLSLVSFGVYFYYLIKMFFTRAQVTHDIWARHMYVGFLSFFIAIALFIIYFFQNNTIILNLAFWILFIGFFGFVIIGNFYKIIPFLVWFHIYSPLIEEQEVPMLHQLLPKKLSNIQFIFSLLGFFVTTVGLYISNSLVFYSGVTFLGFGGILFFSTIYKVLQTK